MRIVMGGMNILAKVVVAVGGVLLLSALLVVFAPPVRKAVVLKVARLYMPPQTTLDMDAFSFSDDITLENLVISRPEGRMKARKVDLKIVDSLFSARPFDITMSGLDVQISELPNQQQARQSPVLPFRSLKVSDGKLTIVPLDIYGRVEIDKFDLTTEDGLRISSKLKLFDHINAELGALITPSSVQVSINGKTGDLSNLLAQQGSGAQGDMPGQLVRNLPDEITLTLQSHEASPDYVLDMVLRDRPQEGAAAQMMDSINLHLSLGRDLAKGQMRLSMPMDNGFLNAQARIDNVQQWWEGQNTGLNLDLKMPRGNLILVGTSSYAMGGASFNGDVTTGSDSIKVAMTFSPATAGQPPHVVGDIKAAKLDLGQWIKLLPPAQNNGNGNDNANQQATPLNGPVALPLKGTISITTQSLVTAGVAALQPLPWAALKNFSSRLDLKDGLASGEMSFEDPLGELKTTLNISLNSPDFLIDGGYRFEGGLMDLKGHLRAGYTQHGASMPFEFSTQGDGYNAHLKGAIDLAGKTYQAAVSLDASQQAVNKMLPGGLRMPGDLSLSGQLKINREGGSFDDMLVKIGDQEMRPKITYAPQPAIAGATRLQISDLSWNSKNYGLSGLHIVSQDKQQVQLLVSGDELKPMTVFITQTGKDQALSIEGKIKSTPNLDIAFNATRQPDGAISGDVLITKIPIMAISTLTGISALDITGGSLSGKAKISGQDEKVDFNGSILLADFKSGMMPRPLDGILLMQGNYGPAGVSVSGELSAEPFPQLHIEATFDTALKVSLQSKVIDVSTLYEFIPTAKPVSGRARLEISFDGKTRKLSLAVQPEELQLTIKNALFPVPLGPLKGAIDFTSDGAFGRGTIQARVSKSSVKMSVTPKDQGFSAQINLSDMEVSEFRRFLPLKLLSKSEHDLVRRALRNGQLKGVQATLHCPQLEGCFTRWYEGEGLAAHGKLVDYSFELGPTMPPVVIKNAAFTLEKGVMSLQSPHISTLSGKADLALKVTMALEERLAQANLKGQVDVTEWNKAIASVLPKNVDLSLSSGRSEVDLNIDWHVEKGLQKAAGHLALLGVEVAAPMIGKARLNGADIELIDQSHVVIVKPLTLETDVGSLALLGAISLDSKTQQIIPELKVRGTLLTKVLVERISPLIVASGQPVQLNASINGSFPSAVQFDGSLDGGGLCLSLNVINDQWPLKKCQEPLIVSFKGQGNMDTWKATGQLSQLGTLQDVITLSLKGNKRGVSGNMRSTSLPWNWLAPRINVTLPEGAQAGSLQLLAQSGETTNQIALRFMDVSLPRDFPVRGMVNGTLEGDVSTDLKGRMDINMKLNVENQDVKTARVTGWIDLGETLQSDINVLVPSINVARHLGDDKINAQDIKDAAAAPPSLLATLDEFIGDLPPPTLPGQGKISLKIGQIITGDKKSTSPLRGSARVDWDDVVTRANINLRQSNVKILTIESKIKKVGGRSQLDLDIETNALPVSVAVGGKNSGRLLPYGAVTTIGKLAYTFGQGLKGMRGKVRFVMDDLRVRYSPFLAKSFQKTGSDAGLSRQFENNGTIVPISRITGRLFFEGPVILIEPVKVVSPLFESFIQAQVSVPAGVLEGDMVLKPLTDLTNPLSKIPLIGARISDFIKITWTLGGTVDEPEFISANEARAAKLQGVMKNAQ